MYYRIDLGLIEAAKKAWCQKTHNPRCIFRVSAFVDYRGREDKPLSGPFGNDMDDPYFMMVSFEWIKAAHPEVVAFAHMSGSDVLYLPVDNNQPVSQNHNNHGL